MIAHKSFRLHDADRNLLKALHNHYGVSQSDVLRMALRNEARAAGLVGSDGRILKGPFKGLEVIQGQQEGA